jgi:hypothetical protein
MTTTLQRTQRSATATPSNLSISLVFDADEAGAKATAKALLLITDFCRSWGVARSSDPRDLTLAVAQREYDIQAALDPDGEDMEDVAEWLRDTYHESPDPLMATCLTADEYEAALVARDTPIVSVQRIDYQAIKNQVDILEYIGRYSEIRRSGGGYKFMCPLHEDKHPSAHIYVSQKRWWCFVCNTGGDVIDYERARSRNDRALPA